MAKMVRKQVYIYKRQEAQLKHIAEARGVSEAEIIRTAIDREVTSTSPAVFHPDPEALDRFIELVRQRKLRGITGEPYQWRREDAYDDPRTKRLLG
jgi:hypothetical protein